jgi:hypothetical protein
VIVKMLEISNDREIEEEGAVLIKAHNRALIL